MLKLITRLGVVAVLMAIIAGPFSANVTYAAPVLGPENTATECSDSFDNDSDLLVDMSDSDCSAFAPIVVPPPVILENTALFCADGIDNDGDLLVDISDSDCAAFAPIATSTPSVPEDTQVLCSDTLDNDNDLLVDMSDSDCAAFYLPATSTPTSTPPTNNGGSSSSGGGTSSASGFSTFTSSPLPTTGTVLGAVTGPEEGEACTFYTLAYMKRGAKNDVNEVKKLQVFLNNFNGANLPVTGYFGAETEAAVHALQTKYATQILKPWADAGLMNPIASTGYVYKTTQYFINMQICPSLPIPAPVLK